jgi:hypothetical protein
MHPLLTLPVFASVEEYIPIVGILVPITLFVVALLIVAVVLYFKHQNRRQWHETARLALEKGQPIPNAQAMLDAGAPPKPENGNTSRRDIRAGLILLALAAGLYFGGAELHVPTAGIYIPGFIGLALLLNALITYLITKKHPEKPSPSQPPKA